MFRCAGCYCWTRSCALALAFLLGSGCAQTLIAQDMLVNGGAVAAPYGSMSPVATPYGDPYGGQPPVQAAPPSEAWIAPPQAGQPMYGQAPYAADPVWGAPVVAASPSDFWCWQLMPKNVIYHSYQAGVHEPRLGIVVESERESHQSFWDGTLGGRVGLLRYGTNDMFMPQGWELDVEAAAMVRLTFDEVRDFETADYRVGIPLTYGINNWQFKFAVYHLSSHLGDEFAIAHPGSLDDRINYVRDSLAAGVSYYPEPFIRLYAEAGWCFHFDGGAEPWEFQLGTELSKPGPTGFQGTPFLAVNGHLRQDVDFGGDVNTEAGWLWRNETNQVMRAGVQYFYGHSSQYQTFSRIEQQIGFGLWYDF
jgi:hypothetical protein